MEHVCLFSLNSMMVNLAANRVEKKFVTPIPIARWVVMIYENKRRFGDDRAQKMVQDFVHACSTVGMSLTSRKR